MVDKYRGDCYTELVSDIEIVFEMKDTQAYITIGPSGPGVLCRIFLKIRLLFYLKARSDPMETRIALISIIVENPASVAPLNELLHQYGQYIIGRMGIPYRQRSISIISVAVEAPQTVISALSGKLGRMDGVSAKAAYSNYVFTEEEA